MGYTIWPDGDVGEFLAAVNQEVARAREKFPSSRLSMAALTEEVGELAQAMLKVAAGKWPKERIQEEAIQVAAMAVRVATEGDPSFTQYTEPDDDKPENGRAQKLTAEKVRAIREKSKHGATPRELALEYGVSRATISDCIAGLIWKDA